MMNKLLNWVLSFWKPASSVYYHEAEYEVEILPYPQIPERRQNNVTPIHNKRSTDNK